MPYQLGYPMQTDASTTDAGVAVDARPQRAPCPFEPEDTAQAFRLAEQLARSSIVPHALRGNAANVFVVLMTGRELGLSPMKSLAALHVIDGKVGMSAQLLLALVHQSGKAKYFRCIESTPERATYATRRFGWGWECPTCNDTFDQSFQGKECPSRCAVVDDTGATPDRAIVRPIEQRLTFTIDDARSYGLLGRRGGNYESKPAVMLRWRAQSQLARDAYPDITLGLYSDDELEEVAATAPTSVREAGVAGLKRALGAEPIEMTEPDDADR